jgi:hypothetical protein
MPRPKNTIPTREQWLAMYKRMSTEDQDGAFLDLYEGMSTEDQERRWLLLREVEGLPPHRDFKHLLDRFQVTRCTDMLNSAKLSRHRKPRRNAERNAEIIRLHVEEGKTFGEIGSLLKRKNRAWTGRDGRPLGYDTVKKAFYDEMEYRDRYGS